MKNTTYSIEKLIQAIEVFKKPTSVSVASKKLCCTKRTVYRIMVSMENDGFLFVKKGPNFKLFHCPGSVIDRIEKLCSLLQSMSIK